MDLFIRHGYRKHELAALNRCRIYLQVVTLSDIVSGDRLNVLDCIFLGKRIGREDRYEWPAQGRPSKIYWNKWNYALAE
eukprot:3807023-Ditylum_brightwellii.AAC.1